MTVGPPRRRSSLWSGLALAVLPALVFGAYARWPGNWGLAYFVLIPWVVLYTDPRRPRLGWPQWLAALWLCQFLLYLEAKSFGPAIPAILATLNFWPWIPCAPLWRAIHRRWNLPRTLTVPLVWTGTEWLRAEWSLSHMDAFPLGSSQAPLLHLIQFADVTGIYGVSFLVAGVNGLFADAIFAWRDADRTAGWRSRAVAALKHRRCRVGAVALGLAGLAALTYGHWRLERLRISPGPRVALVQPNIRHKGTNLAGVHLTQLWMTETRVGAGAVDLIVWPENAVLGNLLLEPDYLADVTWLASRKRAWLLLGAQDKPGPGGNTNTAFLIRPDGTLAGRYDKVMLAPGGEYVPLERWFAYVPPLHRAVLEFTRGRLGFVPRGIPGPGMRVLTLQWNGKPVPFAVLICVENVYPVLPAQAVRLGARFLVNITSEGELAGPLQVQFMRLCQFRAVENRVGYVRVGNTGISGIVGPSGRVRALLRGDEGRLISDAGVMLSRVPLAARAGPTLYARSHDAFAKLCLAVSLGLAAWGLLGRRLVAGACLALLVLGASCGAAASRQGEPALQPRAALIAGYEALRQGRYGEAVSLLKRACADLEPCREALRPLAGAYATSRQPERGILFLESVRTRYPQLEPLVWECLGVLHEEVPDEAAAVEAYRRAVALEPAPGRYALLGNLLRAMGREEEAEAVFREGRQRFPAAAPVRRGLGRTLRVLGRREEALRELEALVRDAPEDWEAWIELGAVYMELERLEAARGAFREALRLKPASIRARLMLARVALREGRLQAVQKRLSEILELEAPLARDRPRS